jgi:SpoVK/Ycf46/Vps4 family AAA+-type ATPase
MEHRPDSLCQCGCDVTTCKLVLAAQKRDTMEAQLERAVQAEVNMEMRVDALEYDVGILQKGLHERDERIAELEEEKRKLERGHRSYTVLLKEVSLFPTNEGAGCGGSCWLSASGVRACWPPAHC